MITIITAIQSLRPGAMFSVDGCTYDGLKWLEKPVWEGGQKKPTKAEVEAEVARLQAEYQRTEYQRQRAPEYPDLKEFVDAYYWAQKGDNTKMDAYIVKCDTVKDKYPKPE
jgi:hypothetical protein